jgi:putative membrane protein
MASENDSPRWHYLHPASLIFHLAGLAKNLILPGLAVLLLSRGESWQIWLMLFVIPTAAYGVFRYLTLQYRFSDTELIVHEGLLFRNERHIPLERVHNIDLKQGFLYRLFGLAHVRVQTAGGSELEADLDALSLAAVDELRTRVLAHRASPKEQAVAGSDTPADATRAATEGSETLVHLGPGELLRLGMISGRGWALIAVALGLAWELDLYEWLDKRGWFPAIWENVREFPIYLIVLVCLATAIPTTMLFSILWVFLRLHDFRLVRIGDGLHLSCGLLTRRVAMVPRHRIQFVSVHETLLHRLLGRVSIRVETASGGTQGHEGDEDVAISQKWLVPLLPHAGLPDVLRALQADLDLSNPVWVSLAPAARRRMLKRNLAVALLAGVACTAVAWPGGALALFPFVGLAIFFAIQSAKYMGYARTPSGIIFRSGVLNRKTSATTFAKVQIVAEKQSPFDRRYGMASVMVDTAGAGPADHKIAIPYLDAAVAQELRAEIYDRAQACEWRW